VKKEIRSNVYRNFSRLLISALTGQAKLSVMICAYGVVAVLLLTYVSAQVYADVLRQEIAGFKQTRCDLKEDLNMLTSDYIAYSSRSRVSGYCEKKLGMVKASGESLEILAVEDTEGGFSVPAELTKRQRAIPSAYRYTLRRCDENLGQ
jgi:hypothetical protein